MQLVHDLDALSDHLAQLFADVSHVAEVRLSGSFESKRCTFHMLMVVVLAYHDNNNLHTFAILGFFLWARCIPRHAAGSVVRTGAVGTTRGPFSEMVSSTGFPIVHAI